MVLRPDATATPDELREFLSSRFAKWQLPDAFVFLDELPHTSTGKLSKLELRKRFAEWQWESRSSSSNSFQPHRHARFWLQSDGRLCVHRSGVNRQTQPEAL